MAGKDRMNKLSLGVLGYRFLLGSLEEAKDQDTQQDQKVDLRARSVTPFQKGRED